MVKDRLLRCTVLRVVVIATVLEVSLGLSARRKESEQ
jgi:hypothetical protein